MQDSRRRNVKKHNQTFFFYQRERLACAADFSRKPLFFFGFDRFFSARWTLLLPRWLMQWLRSPS
jgi:hypothetical protein